MSNDSADERDTIEAVADSFVVRFRAGERPSIEEYAGRYPELADELRELLPALVLLEQNASVEDTARFAGLPKTAIPPREIGDFEIVREIGRGGMGVVYEAVQQSLGRHVALKVLSSPALLNPTHLERFRLEARAAARLHHTHIVPVFDVGEHNGVHYYAMQFIQGQSLDLVVDELRRLRQRISTTPSSDAQSNVLTNAVAEGLLTGRFHVEADGVVNPAAETGDIGESNAGNGSASGNAGGSAAPRPQQPHALSHSELTSSHSGREFYLSVARVGLQVAEALAYAHSEGILHRDVKPSNLLLDAKGNVWITDFGLARDESSDGLTKPGDFVGTLRYMAPERLGGWSDRRSDLYSLGATLYELLALRPLFASNSGGQLVGKILHENPLPPSKSDPAIPRDLETIVLKAIAKEPASRYRSADEMAEDLGCFLADRPILARRSTPAEQFARWCRRNPLPAALAAAIAIILLLGSIISTGQALRAMRAEEAARQNEAAAFEDRRKALHAEDEAIAAYGSATDDAIAYLIGSHPELGPQERAYLETTLQKWQAFAERQGDDQRSRSIRAQGQARVAYLWYQLGRCDEARRAFESARDLLRRLAAELPEVRKYQEILYSTHFHLGNVLKDLGDADGARTEYEHARALAQDLAARHPEASPYQNYVAMATVNLGSLQRSLGGLDEARALFEQARDLHQNVVEQSPHVPKYQQSMAIALEQLGMLLADLGEHNDAREAFEQGRELRQRLVDQHPNRAEYRHGLADCIGNLGRLWEMLGDAEKSLGHFKQACALQQELVDEFPAMPGYRKSLASIHLNEGSLLDDLGKFEEARSHYERALAVTKTLVEQHPGVVEYQVRLAGCFCNLGALEFNQKRFAEGLDEFDEAINVLTPICECDPRQAKATEFLFNCLLNRAYSYQKLGRYADALADWDAAWEISPDHDMDEIRRLRTHSRIAVGMIDEAVADVEILAEKTGWTFEQWYYFAEICAAASARSTDDHQVYADRAIELLEIAVKNGFSDSDRLSTATYFDHLRDRPDFGRVIASLHAAKPAALDGTPLGR